MTEMTQKDSQRDTGGYLERQRLSGPATILVLIFNLHICTLNAVCHFSDE